MRRNFRSDKRGIGIAACISALVLGVYGYAYAAEVSDVKIDKVTSSSATITWSTDVTTDATVNYGLDPRVGVVRDPYMDKKTHELTIDKLDPSTTYYFSVISTDDKGNKGASSGFSFTTQGKPADKIKKEIQKLKQPEDIKEVVEAVRQVAQDVLRPPAVQGEPKVVAESDTATITWTTDREASSMVYFAQESEYQEGAKNPYPNAQGNPRESTLKHSVTLTGLEQLTTYHFKVVSEDSSELAGESEDTTFKTKATLPRIINPQIGRVQEDSATVTWGTGGVLAKGVVEYTNLRTRVTKSAGDPVYAVNHTVTLSGLEFGTRYSVVITSTNEAGNEVKSKPMTFITVRDLIPPVISKVTNESTLFPSEDVKIQTIMTWITDEPAYCQVFYTQGLVLKEGSEGESMLLEANPLTAHTQVIVGFAPATVYKFWMKCHDEAGNESRSDDFVLITPVKEKSIIDIILENFQGTFGWVKNIGG